MYGFLEKEIQTPMAQGRFTKIISAIRWIPTSRLSTKKSLSSRAFWSAGCPTHPPKDRHRALGIVLL